VTPFDAPEEDIPAPAAEGASALAGLVIARGAAVGLLLAVPAALANSVLADQTPKPKAALNVSTLVVFVGFALAGWLAGREAPGQRAKHGALAALAAFVPVEVIAVLGRLDREAGISVVAIVFVGLLAACLGTMGASVGGRKRKGDLP
jgi:putative membrane protein (TIGR04086 family)